MNQFTYRGRDAAGQLLEGVLESIDLSSAASELFRRGVTPVDIRPAGPPARLERPRPERKPMRLLRERVTSVDLMMFSRQMYTLLKAGVPIMRALGGLQESTPNKALADIIADIRESLDAGRDLTTALARHPQVFSPFYVNMIRVGELTGQLEEIFLRMFHHLEFEKTMREQVKSAIRYPAFVVATMAVALIVINLFVIPAFAKVYKNFNAPLPMITQLLIQFSDFMVAMWPALAAAAIGAGFAFRSWLATHEGRMRWDEWKLRIPLAGKIIVKATLARFARSFALSTRSGVPVIQALSSVGKTVDNLFIAAKIEKIREGVERGESVYRTAAATGVFTPVVLQMVAVGEESGAMDSLMQEIADMYQREVEYELKTLSSQIEPILIIALAGLVLVLALAVFLPIWDLGRTVIKN